MHQLAAVLLVMLFAPAIGIAQSRPDPLKLFLQNYVGTPDAETKTTEYSVAFADLKDDGSKDAIVYLSSDGWCGTGGCTMLILTSEGASYRVVTKATVTRLPIRVLSTKSNGWHDIGVGLAGGGIQFSYEAILSFDGKTYPENPSTVPVRQSSKRAHGQIVMSATAKAKPLYQ
jgi:hypothetical protein